MGIDEPQVRELLDDLGIHTSDPVNYVETFDVNEDGQLSIPELVKGLLKLRGNLEKSDMVASIMVARDIQKSLRKIEAMLIRGDSDERRNELIDSEGLAAIKRAKSERDPQ